MRFLLKRYFILTEYHETGGMAGKTGLWRYCVLILLTLAFSDYSFAEDWRAMRQEMIRAIEIDTLQAQDYLG